MAEPTIPQSAIHRESGEAFVLVETGKDRYARRPVKLVVERRADQRGVRLPAAHA